MPNARRRVLSQQFYKQTKRARSPLDLATAKSYLKVTGTTDDSLIQLLIDSATDWAEKYTARELRSNTWTLSIDEFDDRIKLRKDPIESITSVTRIVSGTATAVAASVYYLKFSTQFSEVLLADEQSWPSDQDVVEHAIVVTFKTQAHACVDQVVLGILRHIAFMYENRGDCDPEVFGGPLGSAVQSGATWLYNQIRIARV